MSPNSILIGQVSVVFTTIGAGVWGATLWVATALKTLAHLRLECE